jgi:anti-sigma regulatory factor (Ser/Thr protein kinase)
MHYQVLVPIEDPSQVAEARRAALQVASRAGFDEVALGKLAIVVTELATNIIKHAKRGEILVGNLRGPKSVDVIALDSGPGIGDVESSLRDGFSSAGTAGQGLGAVVRQSATWEIYTRPNGGSAVIATLGMQPPTIPHFDIGVVCRPVKGEIECGDGWAIFHSAHRSSFMLADGLGHGIAAYEAAFQAMKVFSTSGAKGPTEVLQLAHGALRATRGAAVSIAELDHETGIVKYAGVGNIAGVIMTNGTTRSLVSHNGIVGAEMRKVQEFTSPWNPESLLVMNSDGLSTQWHLDKHAGLMSKSALMIAAVLYRDFQRTRDDSTVMVVRQQRKAVAS